MYLEKFNSPRKYQIKSQIWMMMIYLERLNNLNQISKNLNMMTMFLERLNNNNQYKNKDRILMKMFLERLNNNNLTKNKDLNLMMTFLEKFNNNRMPNNSKIKMMMFLVSLILNLLTSNFRIRQTKIYLVKNYKTRNRLKVLIRMMNFLEKGKINKIKSKKILMKSYLEITKIKMITNLTII